MGDPAPKPEELLDLVRDRDSFFAFLEALTAEREDAERLEREEPDRWRWGGAHNWQNSSISTFLGAASCYFSHPDCLHRDAPALPPTWRDFAEFLYFGKIYE